MQTDPFADFLTTVRNGVRSRKSEVASPSSRLVVRVCEVLMAQGFILGFRIEEKAPRSAVVLTLKYAKNGEPALRGVRRVSRPGRRLYSAVSELKPVMSGLGLSILSTPKGVLIDADCRRLKAGGEVLCQVW